MDQAAGRAPILGEIEADVARLLYHRSSNRFRSHHGEPDTACLEVDEEQDIETLV